ncbi:MAG: hypothetical protein AB8I08_30835 [Sandaracinaceae bacterium]
MKSTRSLRRRLEARVFDIGLLLLARVARTPAAPLVTPVLRLTARGALKARRARTGALSAEELGAQWQRLMPNPKVVPVTHVEDDTAYAEIRIHCPLRGTGDVHACHRIMGYDRTLLEPMGGRFVVLESQAEPGVTHCRVALRPKNLPSDDLVDAHLRVGRAWRR